MNELSAETEKLSKENKDLQQRLRNLQESIDAIKIGNIDALVVGNNTDLKVYTENTADKTYRILIEKMHEGAVTLGKDGTILYCNSSFANMVNLPLQNVTGTKFKNFIDAPSNEGIESLFKQGVGKAIQEEVSIYTSQGKAIPVLISVNTLLLDDDFVLSIILTDLTLQNKHQEELKQRTRQLELKNLELALANNELAFQNGEKEKRAAELGVANNELTFQNDEKEKRAVELSIANKDLTSFTYVSSHDLQEPLRKIQNFVTCILLEEEKNLSETGKGYFLRMRNTAKRMQTLIEDLLIYSRTKSNDRMFEKTDLSTILDDVKKDLAEEIQEVKATIDAGNFCEINIIRFQFRQLMHNLISNSLKFSKSQTPPHIIFKSEIVHGSKVNNELPSLPTGQADLPVAKESFGEGMLSSKIDYCHITYTDNGIGFDPQYNDRIFEVFQRLHSQEEYKGTGMGLAICKRIIENHNGIITASGKLNGGARFDIYLPVS